MRQRRSTILVILGALWLGGCGGDFASDGKTAFERGKYREAVELLDVALGQNPDDSQARFYLGVALERMGRPNQARATLAPLLEDPQYRRRAVRATVDLLIRLEKADEAHALARKVLESDPRDPTLLEAAVVASAARMERSRKAIDRVIVGYLGEGMERRTAYFIGRIVTAPAAEYEQTLAARMAEMKERTGFSDAAGIRPLIEKNRRHVIDLRETLAQSRAVDPSSFTSRLQIAHLAWQQREPDAALAACKEILDIDRDDIEEPERRVLLDSAKYDAAILIRTVAEYGDRIDQGIELLKRASEQFGSGSLNQELARLYYLGNKHDELAGLTESWIEENPRDIWACFYRGWVLYTRKLYDEAIPYLVRAHGMRPNTSAFNLVLGRAYLSRGDAIQAIGHLSTAQQLSPRDPHIVIDLAKAYVTTNEPDRAREVLVTALRGPFAHRRSPESKVIMAALVKMYQGVGQGISNVRAARRLHERDADNPYVALRLAQLEFDAGSWERAWPLIQQVHTAFPELADGWRIGAEIAIRHRAWFQAHRQLDELERLEPGDTTVAWMRANTFIQQKRYEDARKAALDALDKNPGEAGILLVLADIEIAQKNWGAAIERARGGLKLHEDDVRFESRLAIALAGSGDWKSAVALLRKVEAKTPDDREVLATLGRGLAALGDPRAGGEKLLAAFEKIPAKEPMERWMLAIEMFRVKAFAACETATRAVIKGLKRDSPTIPYAYAQLARAQHYQGKYVAACDTMVGMRREGHTIKAYELFITLAAGVGAWHEAAAAYDLVRAQGTAPAEIVELALRAQLGSGNWKGALESIRKLGQLKPQNKPRLALERAQAQLGMNRKTEALTGFQQALARAQSGDAKGRVYEGLFRMLLERDAAREVVRLLPAAAIDAGEHPGVCLLAGQALLELGQSDPAVPLLEKAARRCKDADKERAGMLLATAQVARESYAMASTAASQLRSTEGRDLARLIHALNAKQAPKGGPSLAVYLWELKNRRFESAAKTATKLRDMPRAWQAPLVRLAAHLSSHEARASRIAEIILRAVIMTRMGVLEVAIDASLAAVIADHPADALWLDAFRAWSRLEFGSARAAGAIVVPRIASGSKEPLLLELAAFAALKNTDADNVLTVVNGQVGKDAVPAPLARDIADELVKNGALKVADRLLARISDPTPADLGQRVRIALQKEDVSAALAIARTIDAKRAATDPILSFARALGRFREGDKASAEVVAKQLANRVVRDLLPLSVVIEVLVAIDRERAALNELSRRMASQPYDAHLIHQAYQAFARAGRAERAAALAAASGLVDPRGMLRVKPRGKRPTGVTR